MRHSGDRTVAPAARISMLSSCIDTPMHQTGRRGRKRAQAAGCIPARGAYLLRSCSRTMVALRRGTRHGARYPVAVFEKAWKNATRSAFHSKYPMASAGRRALGLTVFMLRSGLCVGSSGVDHLRSAAPPCFVIPGGRACGTAGERRRSTRFHSLRFFAAAAGGKGAKALALDRLLQQQGFGTRKLCQTLVKEGYVTIMGRPATDPSETVVPEPGMHYTVDDEEWEYHELSYILLNKPPGYECSQKPSAHPSVMDLLPSPFRER